MIIVDNKPLASPSIFTSFRNWVDPYHSLTERVAAVRTRTLMGQEVQLSVQEKGDFDRVLRLASGWSLHAGRMSRLVNMFEPDQMESVISELVKDCTPKQMGEKLDVYMRALSRDALLQISEFKTGEAAMNRFYSCGLVKNSAHNDPFKKETRAIFKEFVFEFKHFVFHILDIFVGLLDVSEVGNSRYRRFMNNGQMDSYMANAKLEVYMKILGYPAVLFGFIVTYVKMSLLAGALTGIGIAAAMTLLVCYERYWKPCPKEHSPLKNLTVEMYNYDEPVYPRRDILKEVESAFKEKKGVLLVGEPGCGKSSIPRALAVELDKKKICSFIKNPQVFSCGAANFRSWNNENDMASIIERFQKYKNQVIFFFDEFHTFFKTDGSMGSNTTDEIKLFYENFKYIIGATTTEEYEKIIKPLPAVAERRFKVIHVPTLEDEKIKTVLSQYLQAKYPKVALGSHVIDYIVDNAVKFNPKTSKVDAAQSLLNRAIEDMTNTEFRDDENKVIHLEDQAKFLEQQLLYAEDPETPNLINKLEGKNSEVAQAKQVLNGKNRRMKRVGKLESYQRKLRDSCLAMSNTKETLKAGSYKEREWISLNSRVKLLGKTISEARSQLELPRCLDKGLIDKILSEKVSA